MARRRSKPSPTGQAKRARQRPARSRATNRSRSGATPEQMARAAVAHEARGSPSGDIVRLPLTLSLSRERAERLTARAIREGKNLDALVAEILEAASDGD